MAAARFLLQRRLGSVLGLNRARIAIPLAGIRLSSTKPELVAPTTDLQDEPKSSETNSNIVSNFGKEQNVTYKAFSSLKMSTRHDMAMIFTCKVCETRSMKTASRESYETGVVVARCPGCNNLHSIADRLGWFGETGSVEDFLAAKGEDVKKGSVDTLNFTLEDLAGTGKSS
ncbi:DNL-type zinc finger protein [Rhynchospora pubera]|uniref:DNL-type zinc finger protein n=1 Tax=Rhynchospora pubera TaxID=906938 RepID=A0AAV8EBK2_9POAL|nr:DNL-type zinc finger protein [Rhynchospora pubera]